MDYWISQMQQIDLAKGSLFWTYWTWSITPEKV